MSANDEINFGFFKKDSDGIDLILKIEDDLSYDFCLEASNITLIMDKLLSTDLDTSCILCQVKFIMNKNVIVRLLFTTEYSEVLYPNLQKIDVNDDTYLLAGTLGESISTLTPAFIGTLKANKMIGVCCISVKLLREKITTWVDEKGSLGDVLKSCRLPLYPHLPKQTLPDLRVVSKETKNMVDLRRPMIFFEQSNLPEEFEYTQRGFEALCARYGRKPKDCALHIRYLIDDKNKQRNVVIKTINTEGKTIDLLEPEYLAKTDIKLSISIECNLRKKNADSIGKLFSSLCSIIGNLKLTIYSLTIDFYYISLIRQNYNNFLKILVEIPNLTILKLFNAHIQWKPLLSSIKSIKKLEELDLSNVHMFTNLNGHKLGDPEHEDFDKINFKDIFCDSLKHLTSIRIEGDHCFVAQEQEQIVRKTELFDVLVDCLEHFTNLRSLGFDYHVTRTGMFVKKLPDIEKYLGKISRLDLSDSNLEDAMKYAHTIEHIEKIISAFSRHSSLTELDLSSCNLSMENFKEKHPWTYNLSLMDVIERSTVKKLDITYNKFSADDIKEMKEPFKDITFIWNEFTDDNDDDEEDDDELD